MVRDKGRDYQEGWVRHDQRWSKTNGAYGTSTKQLMIRMENASIMGIESNKKTGMESNREWEQEVTEGQAQKVKWTEMESEDRTERRGLGEIKVKGWNRKVMKAWKQKVVKMVYNKQVQPWQLWLWLQSYSTASIAMLQFQQVWPQWLWLHSYESSLQWLQLQSSLESLQWLWLHKYDSMVMKGNQWIQERALRDNKQKWVVCCNCVGTNTLPGGQSWQQF